MIQVLIDMMLSVHILWYIMRYRCSVSYRKVNIMVIMIRSLVLKILLRWWSGEWQLGFLKCLLLSTLCTCDKLGWNQWNGTNQLEYKISDSIQKRCRMSGSYMGIHTKLEIKNTSSAKAGRESYGRAMGVQLVQIHTHRCKNNMMGYKR